MMKNYLVTYESYKSKDYCLTIKAYDLPHLISEAHKTIYKRDELDKIIKVHEYKNS